MKNPGTAIRKKTINLVLVSCILTPVVLRKCAIANEVANFANSDG